MQKYDDIVHDIARLLKLEEKERDYWWSRQVKRKANRLQIISEILKARDICIKNQCL